MRELWPSVEGLFDLDPTSNLGLPGPKGEIHESRVSVPIISTLSENVTDRWCDLKISALSELPKAEGFAMISRYFLPLSTRKLQ